jgi:ABC-type Fe3+-hydroxamate transport system substrate-binding protein
MFLTTPRQLGYSPKRIVSLVPSQTELLYHLGLVDAVVGVTKFCVHPKNAWQQKLIVGGTKQLHRSRIDALAPDLIIANKEENTKQEIESLAQHYPVWVTEVHNLPSALGMIADVGVLTNTAPKATELIEQIKTNFCKVAPVATPLKTAYLIWQQPYMAAGAHTFISAMLQCCGFVNLLNHSNRYPTISLAWLQQSGCELLLLSSEPYPFKQKHVAALAALLPHTHIVLVDGEYFSWYGSRLLEAPAYFNQLIAHINALQLPLKA